MTEPTVTELLHALLETRSVWLSVARATDRGRAARDYLVYDAAGNALFTARAFPWQRDIVLQTATAPALRILTIRRRRSFPLSGRLDVYDERMQRLGVVSRSGVYRCTADGASGRFRDARRFGERARESVVVGVLDALFSGDGSVVPGSGPSGFVWLHQDRPIGALTRAPLPFSSEPEPGRIEISASGGRAVHALVAAIVRRVRALATSGEPRGWRLALVDSVPHTDPRILVAAALFAIELSHW